VCTAGVLEDGSFIRLYPIDYRYRPYGEWFAKYQWIELEAERNPKDPRQESFRPVHGTSIRLGEKVSTRNNWAERKRYVLAKGAQTMCALQAVPQTQCSLGIVQPSGVSGLKMEPADREWKPRWESLFRQLNLIGPQQKPLEKIPYDFSYVFACHEPNCKGHEMVIVDWEVGQLYRSMRDKWRDEETAAQKVREKFFDRICGPNIDTHFFVGTILRHGTWIVLGTFWPKKEA